MALICCSLAQAGKSEKVSETVVAYKDGETIDSERILQGSSYVYRSITNYIVHTDSKGVRMLLTVKCVQRTVWRSCFVMRSGESYAAVFEYRRNKDSDIVWITGQPGGNLTKPVQMKSTIVNFAELTP